MGQGRLRLMFACPFLSSYSFVLIVAVVIVLGDTENPVLGEYSRFYAVM